MTEPYRKLFELFMLAEELEVSLMVRDGKLYAGPADRITPELAARIKADKDAIKSAIERSSNLPVCRLCSGSMVPLPTFDGYENFECRKCGESSGCRRKVS